MKKNFVVFAFAMLMALALTGCGNKETLTVFMPGEYIADGVIPSFEKEYNCKVKLELFDSNEMMYTKYISGGSYDIMIPSDYMIEKLTKEDQLKKIDTSKLANYDKVLPSLKTLPANGYDPNNEYSVPYFWGEVGIVYSKSNVDYNDLVTQEYEILQNTKYKGRIYMYDSERDAFMIALKSLGYSSNTDNEEEIMAAFDWLVQINTTMDPTTVTDDVIDGMAQGRRDLAIMYNGDAAYALSENDDLGFYVPECGSNVFVDAMVIPVTCQNEELAYKFIDYMLSYETGYANTEEVGYTAVNVDVYNDVTSEGGLYYGNEAYIPREGNPNDEVYHDVDYLRKRIAELWIKVKASK